MALLLLCLLLSTLPPASPDCPPERLKDPGCPSERLKDPDCPSERLKDPGCPSERLKDPGCPSERLKDPDCPSERLKDPDCPSERLKDPDCPSEPLKDPDCPSERLKDPDCPSEHSKDQPDGLLLTSYAVFSELHMNTGYSDVRCTVFMNNALTLLNATDCKPFNSVILGDTKPRADTQAVTNVCKTPLLPGDLHKSRKTFRVVDCTSTGGQFPHCQYDTNPIKECYIVLGCSKANQPVHYERCDPPW